MAGSAEGDAAWEQLRGTRWNPPPVASACPERRKTYVFALEQAEQMFRAAAGAGVATRPLLAFYGLSQAGRAVAAAATAATGDEWALEGHGIRCPGGTLRGPLPFIEVQAGGDKDRGSFARLSRLLGSSLWPKQDQVTLSALWDMIPENRHSPLHDTGEERRTPLGIDHQYYDGGHRAMAWFPVFCFPPRMAAEADGDTALKAYLAAFPDLPSPHSYQRHSHEQDSGPAFVAHVDGWTELSMCWEVPGAAGDGEKRAFAEAMSRPCNGQRWLFPAAGTSRKSMHPLMAWWAVLYTLSMLARYQPAEWAAHIDIDASPHAAAIESLLKKALVIVPLLIAEAIGQAAAGADR
jgi:YaaC-like Protein